MTEATFVANLLRCRRGHEAMVWAMVGDFHAAEDVYQQAAMAMTKKREGLPEDCNFKAWSRAVIVNVIRDFRKQKARQRVWPLGDEALERVAEAVDGVDSSALDARREALSVCLDEMAPGRRELLRKRYDEERSVENLAAETGRSRGALETVLWRIRKALAQCIERRLRMGAAR